MWKSRKGKLRECLSVSVETKESNFAQKSDFLIPPWPVGQYDDKVSKINRMRCALGLHPFSTRCPFPSEKDDFGAFFSF